MKQLLVLLFISILTSGCAPKYSNFDVASGESGENIANSEMAYVLINITSGDTEWRHTGTDHSAEWNNRDMVLLKQEAGFSSFFIKDKYYFVQLVPGTYTMTHFQYRFGYGTTFMTDKARERNEALKHSGGLLASFNVEKGKINYIGDFYLEAKPGTFTIDIKDNHEAALEYLRKKYPRINPDGLFTVRLIQKKQ